jgi:type II secretory pathway predicted ATPase ExeA
MYAAHWKLDCRPFDNATTPPFYYPGQTHQATQLKLRYAVENRRGAALMVGASGLGKTLLVQSLFDELPDQYGPLVHLRFPQMPSASLLAFLADEVSSERSADTTIDCSLHRIEDVLAKNLEHGRHAVVVFDEAHLLRDAEVLETIRLLLNFEAAWTMLLVGQPGLLPVLKRIPELEERFSVKCLLRRFTMDESIGYINHRMAAAGAADTNVVFDASALETIHQLSEGVPRRINRLCDLALLVGFAEEQSKIKADHIEAIAEELETGSSSVRQAA